jgi:hypothetical protein
MVRHKVACGKWRVGWKSAVMLMMQLGQSSGPVPTLTCAAGNGGVRSSREKPKCPEGW